MNGEKKLNEESPNLEKNPKAHDQRKKHGVPNPIDNLASKNLQKINWSEGLEVWQYIRPLDGLIQQGRGGSETEEDLEDVVDPRGQVGQGDEHADQIWNRARARASSSEDEVADELPEVEEGRQGDDGQRGEAPERALLGGRERVVPRQEVQAAEDTGSDGPRDAEVDLVAGAVGSVQVRELVLPALVVLLVLRPTVVGAGMLAEPAAPSREVDHVGECRVDDRARQGHVLRFVQPQHPAEQRQRDVRHRGDLERTCGETLGQASKSLQQEPQGLDEGDRFREAALLRVTLDRRQRLGDQVEKIELDDRVHVLHLERLGLVVRVRLLRPPPPPPPAVTSGSRWPRPIYKPAHRVVKRMRHRPPRIVNPVHLAQLVHLPEEYSRFEILCHGDAHHDLRRERVHRHPTKARPHASKPAISFFRNVQMQRCRCAEEDRNQARLEESQCASSVDVWPWDPSHKWEDIETWDEV